MTPRAGRRCGRAQERVVGLRISGRGEPSPAEAAHLEKSYQTDNNLYLVELK